MSTLKEASMGLLSRLAHIQEIQRSWGNFSTKGRILSLQTTLVVRHFMLPSRRVVCLLLQSYLKKVLGPTHQISMAFSPFSMRFKKGTTKLHCNFFQKVLTALAL